MAIGQGLERRGGAYSWRRRLPKIVAEKVGQSHLRVSLRISRRADARYLAAQLDAFATSLFMAQETANLSQTISKQQLADLFSRVLSDHLEKLRLLRHIEQRDGTLDEDAFAADDLAYGWAYRLIASQGAGATIGERDRSAMQAAGLSEIDIANVQKTTNAICISGLHNPSQFKLNTLLESVGADPNHANRTLAQPIYLRALGEANLATPDRDRRNELPFDELAATILEQRSRLEHAKPVVRPAAEPVPSQGVSDSARMPENTTTSTVRKDASLDISAAAKALIDGKREDDEITSKTARQMETIDVLP